eukprot:3027826-Rhodomonas_salina.1
MPWTDAGGAACRRVEGYLSMLLNRLHLHWTGTPYTSLSARACVLRWLALTSHMMLAGIRVDYNVARSLILVAEVVANSPALGVWRECGGGEVEV